MYLHVGVVMMMVLVSVRVVVVMIMVVVEDDGLILLVWGHDCVKASSFVDL